MKKRRVILLQKLIDLIKQYSGATSDSLAIAMLVAMYLSYKAGKFDGYYEGCKMRRQAERQIRRMRY